VPNDSLKVVIDVSGRRNRRLLCFADRVADEPLPPDNRLLGGRASFTGRENVGVIRHIAREAGRDFSRCSDRQLGRIASKQGCMQIAHVAVPEPSARYRLCWR